MSNVSKLDGLNHANLNIFKTSNLKYIKAAPTATVDSITISQSAQDAVSGVSSVVSTESQLTPYNSKDITQELLDSVQKMLFTSYKKQSQLAAYGSSAFNYSTRMLLALVAKNQEKIKDYLINPSNFIDSFDLNVSKIIHSTTANYLSMKKSEGAKEALTKIPVEKSSPSAGFTRLKFAVLLERDNAGDKFNVDNERKNKKLSIDEDSFIEELKRSLVDEVDAFRKLIVKPLPQANTFKNLE